MQHQSDEDLQYGKNEKNTKGHTQELADPLNTIDATGNINFTHEEETNKAINFAGHEYQA